MQTTPRIGFWPVSYTHLTDEKFFGSWSQFRKGILKEVRAKRI